MPSKKKKKKKKKAAKPEVVEFNLSFSDVTLTETDGRYDDVDRLLQGSFCQTAWRGRNRPHFSKIADSTGEHDWNINTNLTITSPFGMGHLSLDLRRGGEVHILSYVPSSNTTFNPDLGVLAKWTQERGWKIPQPHPSLIRTNMPYWRLMWETLIVDSDFLDERYGVRKSLDMRQPPKSEMELAEEEEFEALDANVKAQRRAAWEAGLGLNKKSEPPKADEE